MTDYVKLDAHNYKERDDLFEYINAIKIIADELEASDSRATQMARFTLKWKKA